MSENINTLEPPNNLYDLINNLKYMFQFYLEERSDLL
jgi:hypothetical protein